MISIKNISFGYHKDLPLYQNLSMELNAGCIYGILGENGAGKTTLMKNVSGLLFPKQGKILVNGSEPKNRTPKSLSDIFFIAENFDLPNISVAQFLKLNVGFYPKFSMEKFEAYVEAFKVPEVKRIKQMSFGQQKKLMISFALATNASVLIMDEPTNGLDIASKSTFRKLLASSITDEKMYIISTHQVRDLETILDHVLILSNGQMVLNAGVDEIVDKLSFKIVPDDYPQAHILYMEENMLGKMAVMENVAGEETKLNIELLYGAAVEHHQKIKELFSKTNASQYQTVEQ